MPIRMCVPTLGRGAPLSGKSASVSSSCSKEASDLSALIPGLGGKMSDDLGGVGVRRRCDDDARH
jgi:hypothetical protein